MNPDLYRLGLSGNISLGDMKIWHLREIKSYNGSMVYHFLFLFFFFGTIIGPQVHASPAEEPKSEKKSIDFSTLDLTQNFVGTNINALANRLDSFFATERADDELGRSSVRIRYSYVTRERDLPVDETRYRINLKLPHLEEKFKFKYYKDQKKEKKNGEALTGEEAVKAAKLNKPKEGWTFNADAGVSVAIPPRLITRARLRRNFQAGSFIHRFAEQVTYITDESGLTEETSLQSDLKLRENLLFRFVNSKRWRVLKKDFITTHGPTLLHSLTENDAFSYGFLMNLVLTKGVYYVTSYTASVGYRRNLYKNWVYVDIIPGIDFPKQWSFRRTPFAVFQIEVLFGG